MEGCGHNNGTRGSNVGRSIDAPTLVVAHFAATHGADATSIAQGQGVVASKMADSTIAIDFYCPVNEDQQGSSSRKEHLLCNYSLQDSNQEYQTRPYTDSFPPFVDSLILTTSDPHLPGGSASCSNHHNQPPPSSDVADLSPPVADVAMLDDPKSGLPSYEHSPYELFVVIELELLLVCDMWLCLASGFRLSNSHGNEFDATRNRAYGSYYQGLSQKLQAVS
ncbi:hypothetical protein ACLOJK_013365 [Asimina triloba]